MKNPGPLFDEHAARLTGLKDAIRDEQKALREEAEEARIRRIVREEILAALDVFRDRLIDPYYGDEAIGVVEDVRSTLEARYRD